MPSLLPFQVEGARFLAARPRALLADEMRVGKTPTTIHACDLTGVTDVLVLCPAIARPHWVSEFKRWSGRDARAIVAKNDTSGPPLTGVVVCSYSLLINLAIYKAFARLWGAVIFDESHFLKNEESKRTEAAYRLSVAARYAWNLTGTPMPNNASELYPMMSAYGWTDLDFNGFVDRYCTTRHPVTDRRITGNRADTADELKAKLAPHYLRRKLAQVAPQMPPVRWEHIAVEPGIVTAEMMRCETSQMRDVRLEETRLERAWAEAGEQIEMLDPEAVRMFRRYVGMQKVEPVADLVEAEWLATRQPVVIFGWHRDVLEGLSLMLRQRGIYNDVVDGRTPPGAKQRLQQQFRDGEISHLCCQIVAAGTAINLSVADECLFIEADWTPGNNRQAAFRIVSQFKTRPVRARFVSVSGSIDEAITRSAARKARMEAEIFS